MMVPGGEKYYYVGFMAMKIEEALVNKRKALIMGKPSVYGLERIIKDHHHHHNRNDEVHVKNIKRSFLMIGDNLVTDIQLGKNGEIDTALMLTGVTNIDDKDDAESIERVKPTYVLKSLSELF